MNAPVRKPKQYATMLAAVHDCASDRGQRIAELSEDLRDHLQISGVTELEGMLALIGTIEQGIERMRKLSGLDAERAVRLVIGELLLAEEDDNAVS
jgi:hypothetical protein